MVFNNILLSESTGGGSISLDDTQGFASGYNLVTGRLSLDRGDTILDLSAWQAAGYGESSAVAPDAGLFDDADPFHILEDAVAANMGTESFATHDAPTTDFDGQARPFGTAIDVGADEWSTEPPSGPGGGGQGGMGAGGDENGSGGSAGATDPSTGAGANDDGDFVTDDPGGCACRTTPGAPTSPTAALLIAVGLALVRRFR